MGRRPYLFLVLAWLALLVSGCSSSPETKISQIQQPTGLPTKQQVKKPAKPVLQTQDIDLLLDHYEQWQGVPYRLGGTSTKGVDCSGYVQRVYQDSFDAMLPRTTTQQAQLGRQIKRTELTTGDLVFFRISSRTQHVGVYLKDGQFLHASTSKGVIISQLDNPYWKKRYWMSRRIQ